MHSLVHKHRNTHIQHTPNPRFQPPFLQHCNKVFHLNLIPQHARHGIHAHPDIDTDIDTDTDPPKPHGLYFANALEVFAKR